MFTSINRHTVIGAWTAILTAVAGVGALSGMSITMDGTVLWLLACVVPPAVMLMLWHEAPAQTVAEILHPIDRR